MTGGFVAFARCYEVDTAKTLKNWPTNIKSGKDVLKYLGSKRLKNVVDDKGGLTLLVVPQDAEDVEDENVDNLDFYIADSFHYHQHWVYQSWKTKKDLEKMSDIFDYTKLQQFGNQNSKKRVVEECEKIGLVLKSTKPSVQSFTAEWFSMYKMSK